MRRAAANGIDVFRIFDAMNDVRNMKTAIEAGLKTGKLVEGGVCYTISPVHSPDYFLHVAEKLADMGVQIICLKDMGGLLAPYAAYEIIKKIKSRIALPLHLHSHCTAGLAQMTYMMAIEAGADILDTAISPFSQGTSQPATEQIVAGLMGTPHDTGLDLAKLAKIAEYFYRIRPNYREFESPVNNQIKPDVLISQIPGGMLSNLVAQLRQQKAEDKLEAVLAGEAPGKIGDEIKEKVLGKKEPITCRPADLLKPGLEKARIEAGSMAKSEEDVITYALFPDIAKDYFLHRDNGGGKQPAVSTSH